MRVNSKIKILFIKDGEIIPINGNERRMRVSHLRSFLEKFNYKTKWLSSNFLHSERRFISKSIPNIILLKSIGYKENKSPKRLIHTAIFSIQVFFYLLFKLENYSHIFIAYPTPETLFAILPIVNIFRKPIIIDVRDQWPPDLKINKVYNIYNDFTKFILKNITIKSPLYLLSVSQELAIWFKKNVPKIKPKYQAICPIGSDEEFYGKKNDKRLIKFLYVGSLGINYDVLGIVKAIVSISDKEKYKFEIHIVGEGDQFKKISKVKSSFCDIKLYGYKTKDKIKEISINCNIGLVPHKIDGLLPNKVGEYLCAGLFIFSTIKGNCSLLLEKHNAGITIDRKYKNINLAIDYYKKLNNELIIEKAENLYNSVFYTKNIYGRNLKTLKKFLNETSYI